MVFYLAIAACLLVFPAWVPWMLAVWIAVFVVLAFLRRPAWPPLAVAVILVLVKRLDWAPGLVALGLAMIAAAGTDAVLRRRNVSHRAFAPAALGLLAVAWVAMAWNWHTAVRTTRRATLAADRPIVCVGDSITEHGFPKALAKRLGVPVLDHGKGGITAAEGLARLPASLALRPQCVVVELGGHDYLKGRSRAEARQALDAIIRACREAGAEVVLFEIPRGFVYDPFAGLERELAREHDLEVVEDGAIRQIVLFGPHLGLGPLTGRRLSDDGLHPNAAGSEFLAERVHAALRRVCGIE